MGYGGLVERWQEYARTRQRCTRCRRMPVRPRPISLEAGAGYLVRVAQANGYSSPRAWWRAIRTPGREPEDCLCRSVGLLHEELGMLKGPFPNFVGIKNWVPFDLHAEDFNHRYMRWCPACLMESAYLRTDWSFKLCCVCPHHALILVDRCPSCGERQRLGRPLLARCRCGYPLDRAEAVPAPRTWLDIHQILDQGLHGDADDATRKLSPREWLRLVRYLGHFDAHPTIAHPGQVVGLDEIERAIELVKGAAVLLADWPKNFHAQLARQRESYPDATHIGKAFGPLYRVLYRELGAPPFDFLREAFEDYLRENWFGLLGGRNRRLRQSTVAQHERKPVRSIVQASGASDAIVRHLAQAGSIRGKATRHASGRTTWAVATDEVPTLKGIVEDRITIRQAATLLGISKSRVHELVEAELLLARIRRPEARAATWLLSKASVERLLHAAVALQSVQADHSAPTTCLAQILKTWRLRRGDFPALVDAILSGGVPIAAPLPRGHALSELLVAAYEARTWLRARRAQVDEWISVDAAARQLGLKQQVAYELVARGLLTAEGPASGRRVHRDAVASFQSTYIALADVARANATSPRHMLGSISVAPVCGPSVDGARQYFFRRSDIPGEPLMLVSGGHHHFTQHVSQTGGINHET